MSNHSHVLVLSHRRSGTHLTIDSLINNFPELNKQDYYNIDHINIHGSKKYPLKTIQEALKQSPRVLKSHFLPEPKHYTQNEEAIKFYQHLFATSKIIYVYREPKKVMVSLFEYMKSFNPELRKTDFYDFLITDNHFDPTDEKLNRPAFWKHHVESWKNSEYGNNIFFLDFQTLITDYEEVIKKLAQFLGYPFNPAMIKDVRFSGNNRNILIRWFNKTILNKRKGIKRTSVFLRKGAKSKKEHYLDTQSENYIAQHSGNIYDTLPRAGKIS